MDYEQAKELLHRHGRVILVMENDERYDVHLGDTHWSDDGVINFDCGDEEYYINGHSIDGVELPASDRVTE